MADQLARPVRKPALLLFLSLAAVLFGPSRSQAMPIIQDDSVQIEQAIDTWLHIRPWIDELYVPTADRTSPGDLGPELTGVSLMLRFQGRIIGVGEAHDQGADTLRQATSAAVQDARSSQRVRDLPFEMIESVGKQTCVELELPLQPQPLLGRDLRGRGRFHSTRHRRARHSPRNQLELVVPGAHAGLRSGRSSGTGADQTASGTWTAAEESR